MPNVSNIAFLQLAAVTCAGIILFILIRIRETGFRAEIEKMDRSLRLLSAILGDSPTAIFFIKQNRAVWVSKAAEDILGWPIEKWLSQPSIAFIYPSPEEFERVNREIIYKDIVRRGKITYEYDYVHQNGQRIPTLVIARAINKENFEQGFIFSMIDNTEHRRAEEMIRKLNQSLEQKVNERTKELAEKLQELERFREATVDRELRMKELKEEVERLKTLSKEQKTQ